MRIWLVGGGTAGHVSPLLSLAAELEQRTQKGSLQLLLVSDRSKTAKRLLAGENRYASKGIFSGKFRRYRGRSWLARILDIKTISYNLLDAFLLALGIIQGLWLVIKHKPDAIFINGGSVGVPVGLAARLTRTPYVIHESDTVLGLANRLIAPKASAIATAFDIDLGPKLSARAMKTGIPLKPQFKESSDDDNLKRLAAGLNLEHDLPLVLAIGGSLGASRLNEWLISQADELLNACQLALVAGHDNFQDCQNMVYKTQPALVSRLHLLEYTDRMADLMRLSDVVITRAGATTLMELAATGRPALIVPNDMLSGGHQTANARWFAASGMAEVLNEASISAEPLVLTRTVHSLLRDEPRRRRLGEAISKAHVPDAASQLAKIILETGERADGSLKIET